LAGVEAVNGSKLIKRVTQTSKKKIREVAAAPSQHSVSEPRAAPDRSPTTHHCVGRRIPASTIDRLARATRRGADGRVEL